MDSGELYSILCSVLYNLLYNNYHCVVRTARNEKPTRINTGTMHICAHPEYPSLQLSIQSSSIDAMYCMYSIVSHLQRTENCGGGGGGAERSGAARMEREGTEGFGAKGIGKGTIWVECCAVVQYCANHMCSYFCIRIPYWVYNIPLASLVRNTHISVWPHWIVECLLASTAHIHFLFEREQNSGGDAPMKFTVWYVSTYRFLEIPIHFWTWRFWGASLKTPVRLIISKVAQSAQKITDWAQLFMSTSI